MTSLLSRFSPQLAQDFNQLTRDSSQLARGFRLVSLLTSLLGAAVFASSCAPQQMFGGPEKRKAEVAIVRGWGVQMLSVNDIPVGVNSAGVVVLPGANRFSLKADASNYHDPADNTPVYKLEMQAQAGVEYAITSKRGNPRICAYPLNPSSGEPNFSESAGCTVR